MIAFYFGGVVFDPSLTNHEYQEFIGGKPEPTFQRVYL